MIAGRAQQTIPHRGHRGSQAMYNLTGVTKEYQKGRSVVGR